MCSSDRLTIEASTNKCIGDDTKAAARQSPNCIKKKQKLNNKIWRKTIFDMADGILTPCHVARSWHWFRQVTAPSNVACCSGIVTVNSPSGSTLQCSRQFWDDMPFNLPKRPPYWNSTSGFDFDHIIAVDIVILHQSAKFYSNRTTRVCLGGAIGSVAVRAAWLRWSASLGSRPRLARSLRVRRCLFNLWRWLILGLETLGISRCLNHW